MRRGWTLARGGACSQGVSRSPFRAHRSLALVWLVLLVLTRLSVAAHQAFTPHVTCPVDGELAHAHEENEAGANTGADSAHEDSGPRGGEEHAEHCGLEPATQPASAEPAACVLAVAPLAWPTPPRPVARSVAGCERLFLLAPKQSPPARAG